MIIQLDWDGVVVDTGRLKTVLALRYFGVVIPPERCKADLVDPFLTVKQYREITVMASRMEHNLHMCPVEGALVGISCLQDAGHVVGITTSRDGEFLEAAEAYDAARGLGLAFQGTGYGMSKAPALKLVKADVFVEDDLDKLLDLEGIVRYRVLLSQPYNLHLVLPPGIVRVKNWRDLCAYIAFLDFPHERRHAAA